MGKGLSKDLRERVYGDIESGQSRRAAGRRFGVSAATSVRIAQRMATKGTLEPEKQGRPPGGGKLAPYAEDLIRWVEATSDITMSELAAKLEAERSVKVHPASLSRFLKVQGFSVKKNTVGQRSRSR